MKLNSPYWKASLITFAVMVAAFAGFGVLLWIHTEETLSLGPLFVLFALLATLAFLTSLLLWLLATVVSSNRSRRAKR